MSRVDFKIVLLGSLAVGKTSLLKRFLDDSFNGNSYQNTIGGAFASKEICVNETRLVLGIWDTAGSERYEAMTRIYYRGAKAAIICYDVTDQNSWNRAKFWVGELRSLEEDCTVYICGTKKDVLDQGIQATPDIEIARRYAAGIQAKFFITSSKTGENISELFQEISQDYVSNPANHRLLEETIILSRAAERSRCCFQG